MNYRRLTGGVMLIMLMIAVVVIFLTAGKTSGEKPPFWSADRLADLFAGMFLCWSIMVKIVMITDKHWWPVHLNSLACFCFLVIFISIAVCKSPPSPSAENLSLANSLAMMVSLLAMFFAGPFTDVVDTIYLWQTRKTRRGWRQFFKQTELRL